MIDAGIGRLLISSLHQGIGDVAPSRLDFYENWLSPAGMRDGRLGLAPLGAVLSFIYREGPPINDRIARQAGAHAADWAYADLTTFSRQIIGRLPVWMRARMAISMGHALVKSTVRRSNVTSRLRRRQGFVEIRSPLFDQLRDPASIPMRAFYASAWARLFAHCEVDADVQVAAADDSRWRLLLAIRGSLDRASPDDAV